MGWDVAGVNYKSSVDEKGNENLLHLSPPSVVFGIKKHSSVTVKGVTIHPN
jgi:hypothetical protein